MAATQTIPLLPCRDLDVMAAFYGLLGFEVAYRQVRPNVYLALRRGDAHLHFFGLKPLDPARAFSTCLIVVPSVEELFTAFSASLRTAYGKLPVAGIPRISRYRKGASRFTVVDPAGSSIIFVQRDAESNEATQPPRAGTRLGRALEQARIFRDFKNDDASAAKILDAALASSESSDTYERACALAARAELATAAGDAAQAQALLAELMQLPLTPSEHARLNEDLADLAPSRPTPS